MFDTFSRLVRAAANTAALTVTITADVVTLGGALADRDEPYTVTKSRRIARDAKRVLDDVLE